MKELDLDRAFTRTTESFHHRMEGALLLCKEDAPMKHFPLRTVLIAVLILILLAGTAFGIATHYSVKDFNKNSSEEFQKNIILIDKSYENEYLSLYVTDAVFDGNSISIAMDITPKEGADPVYLYPKITATCNGKELPVKSDRSNCDFESGIWVPDKEMDRHGKYYVEAGIYDGEADGDVQWRLSFMVLKPNWELAYDMTEFYGEESDPPMDEYMQRFRDAYAQKKILLAYGYALDEYACLLPTPEGMTKEEYQKVYGLGPRLAQSEAFTLLTTVECAWTASMPASYQVIHTGDKLEFDDYTIVMGKVTKSFMKVTWEFDVYFKSEKWIDAGITFEPVVRDSDVLTFNGGSSQGGPSSDNDPAHYTYTGEFSYSGSLPDALTFEAYTLECKESTKEETAATGTPGFINPNDKTWFSVDIEDGAFEVKLK